MASAFAGRIVFSHVVFIANVGAVFDFSLVVGAAIMATTSIDGDAEMSKAVGAAIRQKKKEGERKEEKQK